jgi:hypothetical protein
MTKETSSNIPHVTATNSVVPPTATPATHTPTHTTAKVATTPTPPKPVAHKEAVDKGFKVKNIHTSSIALESGIIAVGQTGFATAAERSNLSGQYLEEV